jgi:nucleotide-binding universal stress UspA family protein
VKEREWGGRRGRGKHGNQVGGARAGAGRKSQGLVSLGGRIGPAQVERARQLAAEFTRVEGRPVKTAEVYRRVLRGDLPPLAPTTEPYQRQTIQLDQPLVDAIRARGTDFWTEVRAVLSGDSEHL